METLRNLHLLYVKNWKSLLKSNPKPWLCELHMLERQHGWGSQILSSRKEERPQKHFSDLCSCSFYHRVIALREPSSFRHRLRAHSTDLENKATLGIWRQQFGIALWLFQLLFKQVQLQLDLMQSLWAFLCTFLRICRNNSQGRNSWYRWNNCREPPT